MRRVWGLAALALVTIVVPGGVSSASLTPAFSCTEAAWITVSNTDPLPAAPAACYAVRPGGIVDGALGNCTLNFMFAGSDGRRYIGTAGHCQAHRGQDLTWTPGRGPVARTFRPDICTPAEETLGIQCIGEAHGGGQIGDHHRPRIGEFAYAFLSDQAWEDFALVRLDPGVPASPQMCYFGGPTGIYTATAPARADNPILQFRQFGHGVGIAAATPARTLIGQTPNSRDIAYLWGATNSGDSGSPVILSDGRALGVVLGRQYPSPIDQSPFYGHVRVARLAPAVARAERRLGIRLTLLTAPLAR